jgi:hypothetical protein
MVFTATLRRVAGLAFLVLIRAIDQVGPLELNVWLATEHASSVLVVEANQDIRDAVRNFSRTKQLTPIRERYIMKHLMNMDMQRRNLTAAVRTWPVSLREGTGELAVRFGDDLHLVAQSFASKHDISAEDTATLANMLQERHPESTGPEWCSQRVATTSPLPPQHQCQHSFAREDCITVVFTTCKRLGLFERTLHALKQGGLFCDGNCAPSSSPWHPVVCSVVVIDDGSSTADRIKMMHQWPDLEFHFKSPGQRGHAASMQMMLQLMKGR